MKKYQKNNFRFFISALISILFGTIFAVILQFFKGKVLDYALSGDSFQTFQNGILLLMFIGFEVVSCYLYDRFRAEFVTECTRELKQDVFESILNRNYIAFKAHPQGEYIAKYINEADLIRDRQFHMVPAFWEILFKILLVSTALFVLDWRIAVITIALLTTPLYVPKLVERKLQNAQSAYTKALEDSLVHINDWLAGFEGIKNYSIENIILDKFKVYNNDTMEKLLQDMKLSAVSQLITTLISYLSYFIILICSAGLVLRGTFSAGDFFVAIGMIDQLSYPLIALAGIIRQLLAVKPVCADMECFLDIPEPKHNYADKKELKSCIRFCNVSFSYDGQQNVLDEFNMTLKKGECCLLKGPSGCGKTTVVNLLLKYFEPSAGFIEIDGMGIEQMRTAYGLATVVRQEAILFQDSLRNNLTMYRSVPDSRLICVLNQVGLERYANTQALDCMVTENGANFSGGEKKRICLARALLRDTDLLILDEPLANLDPVTAERIEDCLLSIQNKTVLIVSHQFSKSKLGRLDQVLELTAS